VSCIFFVQYSIRIDGHFTPEARAHICEHGTFGARTAGGSSILAMQKDGPLFLARGADWATQE
jgi:hypothetical protein